MALEEATGAQDSSSGDGEQEPDTASLIVARVRQSAAAVQRPRRPVEAPAAIERRLEGDVALLARTADLKTAPIRSHRHGAAPAVVAVKRNLRRLLYPLLDLQSETNAANARLADFTLRQLAAQAERLEQLERQLAELAAEREP
jgi:hypothetical protein